MRNSRNYNDRHDRQKTQNKSSRGNERNTGNYYDEDYREQRNYGHYDEDRWPSSRAERSRESYGRGYESTYEEDRGGYGSRERRNQWDEPEGYRNRSEYQNRGEYGNRNAGGQGYGENRSHQRGYDNMDERYDRYDEERYPSSYNDMNDEDYNERSFYNENRNTSRRPRHSHRSLSDTYSRENRHRGNQRSNPDYWD